MTNIYQPPQIAIMRNYVQAYIGERDNAELPVSTWVVKSLVDNVIPAVFANKPKPFGWMLTPEHTHLFLIGHEQIVERIGDIAWRETPPEERSKPWDACQIYFWDGVSAMTRCRDAIDLRDRLNNAARWWGL